MKHSRRAFRAAIKLLFWTLVLLLAVFAVGALASLLSLVIATVSIALITVWILFAIFSLYFFRDPDPAGPSILTAIVSPAHGKVDVIDETTEVDFIGGSCKRISIFLSIFDVHVQKAPVSGKIAWLKQTPGKFLSATRADSAEHNENVLLGFEPADFPDQKIAVRLLPGGIARRIVPCLSLSDPLSRTDP